MKSWNFYHVVCTVWLMHFQSGGGAGRDKYQRNLKLLVPFFEEPSLTLFSIEEVIFSLLEIHMLPLFSFTPLAIHPEECAGI
jgi:hypothetical protein